MADSSMEDRRPPQEGEDQNEQDIPEISMENGTFSELGDRNLGSTDTELISSASASDGTATIAEDNDVVVLGENDENAIPKYDSTPLNSCGKRNARTTSIDKSISDEKASISGSNGMSYRTKSMAGHSTASIRSSFAGTINFWSKITKKDDMWESNRASEYGDDKTNNCYTAAKRTAKSLCRSVTRIICVACKNPKILLVTFLTFAVLASTFIAITVTLANNEEESLKNEALDKAEEMGNLVNRELSDAFLPLFTMSQFVKQLPTFNHLPYAVGRRGEPGAAPPLAGKEISHRNITGICDDPDVVDKFNTIAASIKKDAGMEGILVNMQLAPYGLVCVVYPLINSEDFEDGIVMDSTGALGHDLLNDPARVKIARATIPAPGVVTAGPLTLLQKGHPVVEEGFIARLAINMPNYTIPLDGKNYSSWGFAVIILNWANLKKKSGVDEVFKKSHMEYNLTRRDIKINTETNTRTESVTTIAHSENSGVLTDANSVFVDLETTNNLWQMRVGHENGFRPSWEPYVIVAVVMLSAVLSVMLMVILVVKEEMKVLLYKMMPKNIIRKLQRGETIIQRYDLSTIFFSDIVGFTTLSGQMSAIEVMDMLNDLYAGFDKIVEKHGVFKVETIGDAYIVIGGGPDGYDGRKGAEKVALFALEAMEFVKTFKTNNGESVFIRAGLASGPVVAGVVGNTLPKFTLFGDTVNFASRMESTSKQMKIQCNEMTYRLLVDAQGSVFNLKERREGDEVGVFVKGKGHAHTWWIEGFERRSVVKCRQDSVDRFEDDAHNTVRESDDFAEHDL